MIVRNHGNPDSPIWLIYEEPFKADEEKGYILSAGYGAVHRKAWALAGLPDPYIYVLRPCLGASYDESVKFGQLISELCDHGTPLILPTTANLFKLFCPDMVAKSQEKAILKKYAGNLLTSNMVPYPHYIIPQYPADYIVANWGYREIQAFIDYGHVKEEYEFYMANNCRLNPLPARRLLIEPTYDDLISYLYRIRFDYSLSHLKFVSSDIETIRPRKKSYYANLGHPGYPYTLSLATSPTDAVSFSFWDYPEEQLVKIWREIDWILNNVPQIGQNYFTFDTHFLEALGFRICLDKCQDTLLRHHILWPGLEHKLQFQTKQYTREPFYKDEGKQWSPKYKASLMKYNCLDTCVTYEIFLKQEEEFKERPHLL